MERLKESRDWPSSVHRVGGVAEVRDDARERIVTGGLSAEGRENFTLGDGGQVESVARDADGHHDPVRHPFVASGVQGGEERLVEIDDDSGGRRLNVRARGAHARDKGAGGGPLVGHAFGEVGHPGEASPGLGDAGARGGRQIKLFRAGRRVDVDVAAYEFDVVARANGGGRRGGFG